ncbi:hypothetical protein BJ138DRAFT_1117383 [Hygrophoropsis aurantiaca]|uniref:Uncharacterized protein n=1 Tax=Hygrophoropsis aurantiaca TaxID=72124 RepID=A0ACB8A0Y3_9AGAM|nr:hypothetical protein BJ138DRAFT_1117383 [Hygrophoropsis aurantiaca]
MHSPHARFLFRKPSSSEQHSSAVIGYVKSPKVPFETPRSYVEPEALSTSSKGREMEQISTLASPRRRSKSHWTGKDFLGTCPILVEASSEEYSIQMVSTLTINLDIEVVSSTSLTTPLTESSLSATRSRVLPTGPGPQSLISSNVRNSYSTSSYTPPTAGSLTSGTPTSSGPAQALCDGLLGLGIGCPPISTTTTYSSSFSSNTERTETHKSRTTQSLVNVHESLPSNFTPQSSPPTSSQLFTMPTPTPLPSNTSSATTSPVSQPLSPAKAGNQPKRPDISTILIGCAVAGIVLLVALFSFLMWRRRRARGKIIPFRYQDLPGPPSTSPGTREKHRANMAHLLTGSLRASASSSFIQYPDVNDDQESSPRMSFAGDIASVLASPGRATEKVYSPNIKHPEPTYTDSREVSRDPWFSQVVVQDKEPSITSEFLPPYPRSNKSVS